MKKIRIDNDFVFLWGIERNGVSESLVDASDVRLYLVSRWGKKALSDFRIEDGCRVRVELTPDVLSGCGEYRLELHYVLPDALLGDGGRRCAVDTDAFEIVPITAKADSGGEFSSVSDACAGFQGERGERGERGEPFVYSDFTPAQLLALKGDKGDKGDNGERGSSMYVNGRDWLRENYGVTDTENTNLRPFFQRLANYCMENDFTLYLPAGKYWIVGSIQAWIDISANILFDGDVERYSRRSLRIVGDGKYATTLIFKPEHWNVSPHVLFYHAEHFRCEDIGFFCPETVPERIPAAIFSTVGGQSANSVWRNIAVRGRMRYVWFKTASMFDVHENCEVYGAFCPVMMARNEDYDNPVLSSNYASFHNQNVFRNCQFWGIVRNGGRGRYMRYGIVGVNCKSTIFESISIEWFSGVGGGDIEGVPAAAICLLTDNDTKYCFNNVLRNIWVEDLSAYDNYARALYVVNNEYLEIDSFFAMLYRNDALTEPYFYFRNSRVFGGNIKQVNPTKRLFELDNSKLKFKVIKSNFMNTNLVDGMSSITTE